MGYHFYSFVGLLMQIWNVPSISYESSIYVGKYFSKIYSMESGKSAINAHEVYMLHQASTLIE